VPKVEWAYGNAAFTSRNTHQLVQPIKRGIIVDFEAMTNLWKHIFKELNIDSKNANVLLTDAPLNSKENKIRMADIMFEELKVESLAIMNTAVLSLFSTGKTTGIVVECGEGVSYTVPIFEGYALPHAIHKLDIAGQDVTEELIRQLKNDNVPINENHFEYVREMKEQMCSVGLNFDNAVAGRDPLNEE
jgi:actin-related protein